MPSPSCAFGLMRLGPLLLALPVSALREVVAHPEVLAPLPMSGLSGAINLRGSIIPVLELRRALGMPPAEEGRGLVLVMQHEGKVLGLRVDSVCGIAQTTRDRLTALELRCPGELASLASHAFDTEHGVATLMDEACIASLPGIPMVADQAVAAPGELSEPSEPVLLFRCGKTPLGVETKRVDATVPSTSLRDTPLRSDVCVGIIAHHGLDVPVVDTLKVLGLGARSPSSESAVVVLRLETGCLGLTLDNVEDIVHAKESQIAPLQTLGLRAAGLLRGMLRAGDDRCHLVLDVDALQSLPALASLASLSRSRSLAAGPGEAADLRQAAALPYLTFDAAGEFASPLTQIDEVVGVPSNLIDVPANEVGMLGLFMHRGEVVPLLNLATLLGRDGRVVEESARVLIVRHDGRRVGMVVRGLTSIESALWVQPDPDPLGSAGRMTPMVEFKRAGCRMTLPRLDLFRILEAARDRSEPEQAMLEQA